MQQYKRDFIDFMLESEVLKFGKFTLKSGRKSRVDNLKSWENFML